MGSSEGAPDISTHSCEEFIKQIALFKYCVHILFRSYSYINRTVSAKHKRLFRCNARRSRHGGTSSCCNKPRAARFGMHALLIEPLYPVPKQPIAPKNIQCIRQPQLHSLISHPLEYPSRKKTAQVTVAAALYRSSYSKRTMALASGLSSYGSRRSTS